MSNFDDLKKYLQEHPDDVAVLLDSERLALVNAPEVKRLHGKHLTDFWEDRPNKKLTCVIYFEEKVIADLNFNNIIINLSGVITETLKTHRTVNVNKDFSVISSSADEIKHDFLLELSNNGKVVFFFGEEGIDVVVRGKFFPRINVFYDESDRIRFLKKHHISDLQKCLKEYEVFIHEPGNNVAFFASKTLISKIQPVKPPNNTLHNKPEKILRDNLISYLNHNTQHTFSKENELNNQRELDLYAEVEGRKYLIEVKWLGQSINDDESDFTKKVTDYSAREGVTQTLEYIQHLFEAMSYNLHCGYLCVFDAREAKKPIDYENFNFITPDLLPYYKKHFIKLEEIQLSRIP